MASPRDVDPGSGPLPEEQERLRREADAAVRLEGEFLRRLSRHGMRGVDDMVEMHERLRLAAASIALPEIDFALARLGGLIDQLRLLRRKIDRLAAMRRSLDAVAAPAPQPTASFPGAQGRTGHRNGGADPR